MYSDLLILLVKVPVVLLAILLIFNVVVEWVFPFEGDRIREEVWSFVMWALVIAYGVLAAYSCCELFSEMAW